jgi:hypothetical protein
VLASIQRDVAAVIYPLIETLEATTDLKKNPVSSAASVANEMLSEGTLTATSSLAY